MERERERANTNGHTVRFPDELFLEGFNYAKRRGLSFSALICRLLSDHLAQNRHDSSAPPQKQKPRRRS